MLDSYAESGVFLFLFFFTGGSVEEGVEEEDVVDEGVVADEVVDFLKYEDIIFLSHLLY